MSIVSGNVRKTTQTDEEWEAYVKSHKYRTVASGDGDYKVDVVIRGAEKGKHYPQWQMAGAKNIGVGVGKKNRLVKSLQDKLLQRKKNLLKADPKKTWDNLAPVLELVDGCPVALVRSTLQDCGMTDKQIDKVFADPSSHISEMPYWKGSLGGVGVELDHRGEDNVIEVCGTMEEALRVLTSMESVEEVLKGGGKLSVGVKKEGDKKVVLTPIGKAMGGGGSK